ncbi:hypothetical protein [Saccharibacillus alkalitolerans]|uniref:Uncharacterized protein n=1 Tax=Saccharibacillus alkalitolerans TaxID=2705290 RepID=A0ABX0F4C9_9BACL|nr:hypothetical protein [Saccharibacillus alkalitolerans]NGZ75223.1 hypothetical protein [Saccharibacillus alkalitolerans]
MLKTWVRALSVTLAFVLLLGVLSPGLSVRHAAAADGAQPKILLAGGSQWQYLDNGTQPQTVWQSVYEDGAWQSGPAPLGYKEPADEAF